jgi:hypothetical protein
LGEDGEMRSATLDPELQVPYQQTQRGVLFNPGMGKYDVSITVGPSYNTKRMEAQATFVELAKGAADPISAALLRYMTVKNSDFEGAQEAAKAFRSILPPPVQEALSGGKFSPEVQAVVTQAKLQMEALQKELEEEKAGTRLQEMKVAADREAKMKEIEIQREKTREELRLEQAKAEAEFALEQQKAEQERAIAAQKAADERAQFAETSKLDRAKAVHDAKLKRTQALDPETAGAIKTEFEAEVGDIPAPDTIANQVVPMLQQALQAMIQVMQQVEQTQQQMLAEMKKPRAVQLAGLQRDHAGQIAGANVVVH